MNILKIAFLFIAILFTINNFGNVYNKHGVSGLNLIIQSIGIVGFLAIQFNLL